MAPKNLQLVRTRLSLSPRPSGLWVAGLATAALFAGTVAFWLDAGGAQHLWPATRAALYERGEWLRAPLSALAHADPRHFLSNAFLFFVFALLLNGYFGALAFPILPALLAPAIMALTVRAYAPETQLIGASGAVNAMIGQWVALYWLTARHLRLRLRTLRAIGFSAAILIPGAVEPEVSNLAHAIGFAIGLATGALLFAAAMRRIRADEQWVEATEEEEDLGDGAGSGLGSGSSLPWQPPPFGRRSVQELGEGALGRTSTGESALAGADATAPPSGQLKAKQ